MADILDNYIILGNRIKNNTYNYETKKPFPNIDYDYGPYNSISDAIKVIGNLKSAGKKVGIIIDGKVTDYWWRTGNEDVPIPYIPDVTAEISDIIYDIQILKDKNEEYDNNFSNIENNITNINNKISTNEQHIENISQTLTNLTNEIKELKTIINNKNEEIERLNDEIIRLDNKINNYHSNNNKSFDVSFDKSFG